MSHRFFWEPLGTAKIGISFRLKEILYRQLQPGPEKTINKTISRATYDTISTSVCHLYRNISSHLLPAFADRRYHYRVQILSLTSINCIIATMSASIYCLTLCSAFSLLAFAKPIIETETQSTPKLFVATLPKAHDIGGIKDGAPWQPCKYPYSETTCHEFYSTFGEGYGCRSMKETPIIPPYFGS